MSRTFRNRTPKVHHGEYVKHKGEPEEKSLINRAYDKTDGTIIKSRFYHKLKLSRRAKKLGYAQGKDEDARLKKLAARSLTGKLR